ncbi:A/G-specific adenine glycosylase [Simkania negevensis]|uniref:Adenine DNA glycosylase n=1 Tax=Simkania negevensis TaxID=83561 RepID=A0ABS3ARH6_9BACT|nr:A/G-specific adenine glycosylase [Simkania negevensis]
MFSINALRDWFLSSGRDLPWRTNRSPYSVWVSEVMLQQTRASVVISYYERWMKRFPTIEALASADLDEVLKMWEGLGYYSRARNLHAGAKEILSIYRNSFPRTEKELLTIPGIGLYTAGAIRSFAFGEKASAVDGNVLRVIARLYGIKEDIGSTSTKQKIDGLVNQLLPNDEPAVVMEGLIELGAQLCLPSSPHCTTCPLQQECKANKQNLVHLLPLKRKRQKMRQIHRFVPVITAGVSWLVRRGEKGKVMQDLYEFPYFDVEGKEYSIRTLQERVQAALSLKISPAGKMREVTHTYTRYHATLTPHLFTARGEKVIPHYEWLTLDALQSKPFSSGHKKILHEIIQEHSL